MPFLSVRWPGPSVETRLMPGSGAEDEDEAVAASYDGGGSLGAWAADMLEGFGEFILSRG